MRGWSVCWYIRTNVFIKKVSNRDNDLQAREEVRPLAPVRVRQGPPHEAPQQLPAKDGQAQVGKDRLWVRFVFVGFWG